MRALLLMAGAHALSPAPPAPRFPSLLHTPPGHRLRNDTGAFRSLLQAAAPAWLEDPSASVTLLAPTDLALQRAALSVAAFAGPDQQGGGPNATAAGNATAAPAAPGGGNGTAAPGAPGGGAGGNASSAQGAQQQPLSARQLAGVYVLPRPFSLTTLAAMNGSLLETQATGWSLRVHADPPAFEGVRGRGRGRAARAAAGWGVSSWAAWLRTPHSMHC